jgi:hypothetical protein
VKLGIHRREKQSLQAAYSRYVTTPMDGGGHEPVHVWSHAIEHGLAPLQEHIQILIIITDDAVSGTR